MSKPANDIVPVLFPKLIVSPAILAAFKLPHTNDELLPVTTLPKELINNILLFPVLGNVMSELFNDIVPVVFPKLTVCPAVAAALKLPQENEVKLPVPILPDELIINKLLLLPVGQVMPEPFKLTFPVVFPNVIVWPGLAAAVNTPHVVVPAFKAPVVVMLLAVNAPSVEIPAFKAPGVFKLFAFNVPQVVPPAFKVPGVLILFAVNTPSVDTPAFKAPIVFKLAAVKGPKVIALLVFEVAKLPFASIVSKL